MRSIPIEQLCDWLRDRPDRWWTFDGDQELSQREAYPVVSEDIIDVLAALNDPKRSALRLVEPPTAGEAGLSPLERLSRRFAGQDAWMHVAWDDESLPDFLLSEETEFVRQAIAEAETVEA